MLTADEEDFLSKSEDKIVSIKPFDTKIASVADGIVKQVLEDFPGADVHFLGASALKISGQGDIDIYLLSKPENFDNYLPGITKLFGEPAGRRYDSVSWRFEREGIPVELYVTDPASEPMTKQLKVYEILSENENLRNEYAKLKEKFDGGSWKEMQRAKYEFYHKILGE